MLTGVRKKILVGAGFMFVSLLATPVWAQDVSDTQANLNFVWVIVAASLVFLMQAGFTALESGLVRAKNSINVAMKNFGDFVFGSMAFWLVGFGLMFGMTSGGWFGTTGFTLEGFHDSWSYAFFIFQVVFCATAATIVSGAVAERMQYRSYLVMSVILCAVIYPISGHWVWGSGLLGEQAGWLGGAGFIDFAGSTVVHSVGAWVGLAGAWLLGARVGRFDEHGKPRDIPGANTAMATVGVLILWFGWFGFNGGSTLMADGSIAKVILNTNLAAAAGGVVGFILVMIIEGKPIVEKLLNGALGGLVAITAGCNAVEPMGAVFIGATAGAVMYAGDWFLTWVCKIDDPIGAIPVHGFCGAWGTVALVFVAPVENLPAGSVLAQLGIQLQGVTAIFVWAFGCGLVLFGTLKFFNMLRVPPEMEAMGLNVSEHGAKMAWIDTMGAMRDIVNDGDLSRRVEVEIGTEAGEVAGTFNHLLEELEERAHLAETIAQGDLSQNIIPKSERDQLGQAMATMSKNLRDVVERVRRGAEAVNHSAQGLGKSSQDLLGVSQNLSAGVTQAAANVEQTAQAAYEMNDQAQEGIQAALATASGLHGVKISMDDLQKVVGGLDQSSKEIGSIVKSIMEIADQTNLLALNAAIEAARSGEAGRGFSVVADEVRKLAERATKDTKEITTLIATVQNSSIQAVQATEQEATKIKLSAEGAQQSSQFLEQVREKIRRVALMMEELQMAMQCQAQSSGSCAVAAQDSVDVAQNMMIQASALLQAVSFFKDNNDPAMNQSSCQTQVPAYLDEQVTLFNPPLPCGS